MWNESSMGLGAAFRWMLAVLVVVAGAVLVRSELSKTAEVKPSLHPSRLYVLAEKTNPVREEPIGLAKFEPTRGCYLGAYIDLESNLKQIYKDSNHADRRRPDEFEKWVDKPHAMYFFYLGYGRPIPLDWLRYLASQNKFVHIALEPNDGLEMVNEDEYLLQLAKDLRLSGARVFLRFASEMNGDWVKYHGDPTLYKEKWSLVTRIMRDNAPNVAMVWCPYALPVQNIEEYYPGDDQVDWVGVNLYNVSYFNQDPMAPAKDISPMDLLTPVYERYADRKPIMICEYATTHFSALENRSLGYFAANNILDLYKSLRTDFPRVKAINYFSSNNLALAHRRNNNYSLLHDSRVLEAYRRAIRNDYFLSAPQDSGSKEGRYSVRVTKSLEISERTRISVAIDANADISFVKFVFDGKPLFSSDSQRDWGMMIDPNYYEPGNHLLRAEAYDESGNLMASQLVKLRIVRK